MSDFSELNEYLMAVVVDERRTRIITTCQNLANAGLTQVQPDIDRVLNMSNDGEAPDVIDDITKVIFDHLYTTTLNLGFCWAEDISWIEDFNLLSDCLAALTLLDNVEDYGELSRIINDDLLSNEEKVVDIFAATLAKDMNILLERVDRIDEAAIIGIATSITEPYPEDDLVAADHELDYVKERLIRNKDRMYKGLAYEYIACQGALGVDYESLLQFYNDPLGKLIDEDRTVLTQELVGFALISNLIDNQLQDEICKKLDIYIDDKQMLQSLAGIVTGYFA